MSQHNHTCANPNCKHAWVCEYLDDPCPILKAAKVNESGPFCELCYHIVMSKRIAAHRKINLRKFQTPS